MQRQYRRDIRGDTRYRTYRTLGRLCRQLPRKACTVSAPQIL